MLNEIKDLESLPEEYKGTPIEKLIAYHNFDRAHDEYESAELLVGMCMDNRKQLNIPQNFSFIMRTGGANLRYSEFKVSFAVAVGGVRHIALIGHTDCGMVNLNSKREKFIAGLVDAGWDKDNAVQHFNSSSPLFEITNEQEFVLSEVKRLRERYPNIKVCPMIYKVEDNKLYLIDEN